MKRVVFLMIVVLMGMGIVHLLARQDNKKNAVTSTPVKAKPNAELMADSPAFFSFPEFYSFWPIDKNDTVLKYECYDMQENMINSDTLHNINDVKYILLIKTYTDYTRTYIDADGKPQPMPVSSKVLRYEKSSTDMWMCKDFVTKGYTNLKEYRDDIVRADTTSGTNPLTGNKQMTVRKYYKVEQCGPSVIESNQ